MAKHSETTTAQLKNAPISNPDGIVVSYLGTWPKKVRRMRLDPTIKLARLFATAPVIAATWTFEVNPNNPPPEGAKEHIEQNLNPLRSWLMQSAMYGQYDFGWQAFEKVFRVNPRNGFFEIEKLKPLLQDLTEILIVPETGAFLGVRQEHGDRISLDRDQVLLVYTNVEGTNWYGIPELAAVEKVYDSSLTVLESAARFNDKIAGAHLVVEYPHGVSDFDGQKDKPNQEIAALIARAFKSSGSILVPRQVIRETEIVGKELGEGWKISFLESSGDAKSFFIDQLKYYDTLKVRGIGLPERMVLEGQFGTKAESESHTSSAVISMQQKLNDTVQLINWHLVNQLLRINWGKEFENSVFIKPKPLSDDELTMLQDTFKLLLTNPIAAAEIIERIDTDVLRDRIGIPSNAVAVSVQIDDTATEGGEDDPASLSAGLSALKSIREIASKMRS